jgi:hypothetical protein
MNNGSTTMTASEIEATRRRLRIWQEAGPLLEEQRWRELMALTDAQALKMTESLLGRQGIVRVPRDTSGLVEQQTLFQRSRRR